MSYVLHIWEHPVPTSVAEADEILHLLSDIHGEQNPKFIELAKRLTKRYPCISTLPDESPKAVWSDGPLNGKTDRAVYGLGVLTDRLREVLPFVIETANALGLTVYDMQLGEARLPGHVVLTLPGRNAYDLQQATDPEELASARELEKLVLEDLHGLLEAHGFKLVKRENGYTKKFKAFKHYIQIFADDYTQFDARVVIRPNSESELLKRALNRPNGLFSIWGEMARFAAYSPVPTLEFPGDDRQEFHVANRSAAHAATAKLSNYIAKAVLPVLEQCTSWQGVDKFMNTQPWDCALFRGGAGSFWGSPDCRVPSWAYGFQGSRFVYATTPRKMG